MGHCEMLLAVAGMTPEEIAATTRRLAGAGSGASPAEKAAFATNTSKNDRPAPSRKSVLTPQINAADSVYSPASVK